MYTFSEEFNADNTQNYLSTSPVSGWIYMRKCEMFGFLNWIGASVNIYRRFFNLRYRHHSFSCELESVGCRHVSEAMFQIREYNSHKDYLTFGMFSLFVGHRFRRQRNLDEYVQGVQTKNFARAVKTETFVDLPGSAFVTKTLSFSYLK